MSYLLAKALHLVFMVTWFAGLFYVVRLFIYRVEAQDRSHDERRVLDEQLSVMQRRLWYGITWPSLLATVIFGGWLLVQGTHWHSTWFHLKVSLLVGLIGYHLLCGMIRKQQEAGRYHWTSMRLRLWNEVATLFLFAIIFVAVFKSTEGMLWGVTGLVGLALVLMMSIRAYQTVRKCA